MNAVSHVSGWC